MSNVRQWVCYAHPVRDGGKHCGHVNAGDPLARDVVEFCAKCGCTKHASDLRRIEAARKAREEKANG